MAKKMISASDVAKYLLSLQDQDQGDLVSNLKLQKLLYYAQGLHLALFDEPLFGERVEAWIHGPVVPEVYHEFKDRESGAIPPAGGFDPDSLDSVERDFLDEVYTVYGQFSAWKLRNMTYDEAPYVKARGSVSKVLNHDLMRDFFKSYLVQ